jgi:hypothetical protein
VLLLSSTGNIQCFTPIHSIDLAGEAESLYLQQLQQITIPTHPGEVLLEESLNPMGLTQRELDDAIRLCRL